MSSAETEGPDRVTEPVVARESAVESFGWAVGQAGSIEAGGALTERGSRRCKLDVHLEATGGRVRTR